jgi:hypothetical protein
VVGIIESHGPEHGIFSLFDSPFRDFVEQCPRAYTRKRVGPEPECSASAKYEGF